MFGPTSRTNWLTFGADPVLDTDNFSTSLTIAEYGIMGDLLAFLIYDGWRNDWRRQVMNPQHFGNDLADVWIRIRKSGFGSFLVEILPWRRFALSEHTVTFAVCVCVVVCRDREWTCFNRECLHSRQQLCDGVEDCSDGSDESYTHARCPGLFPIIILLFYYYCTKAELCDCWYLFVVLSVGEQDYCKSNQPMSFKLGIMTGRTNLKNWLTFSHYPVPDADFRWLPLTSPLWNRRFYDIY